MEENNDVRTVEKARTDFIGELLDVEELESKLAPGGGKTVTVIISA